MIGKSLSKVMLTTVLECFVGIILHGVIGEIIILCLPVDKLSCMLGLAVGCVYALGSLWHIAHVTEASLSMQNARSARNYTTIRYVVRYCIMGVLLVISYCSSYMNMVTLVIGFLSMKTGAYLQPVAHRFLERRA